MKSIIRRCDMEKLDLHKSASRRYIRARSAFLIARTEFHAMKKAFNVLKKKLKLNTSGLGKLTEMHKKLIDSRKVYYVEMNRLNQAAIEAFPPSYQEALGKQTFYLTKIQMKRLADKLSSCVEKNAKLPDSRYMALTLRFDMKGVVR